MEKIITNLAQKSDDSLLNIVEIDNDSSLSTTSKSSIRIESEEAVSTLQIQKQVSNIGPYELLELIGEGGMGLVYKVRHIGAGNILALKILRKELANDPVNVKRFQQELKTTGMLTHPNMVPVYDSGVTEDGAPFLVMEYIDGWNLSQILEQEGYLDLDRFFHLFTQVCDALIHAHDRRIIHRDLKPSNIMVTAHDTGFESAKIVDFGIARVFQRATINGTKLTQMGDVLGSPVYMSPEQCLSQKLDERSDVYSLGVVMYEAISGAPPFPGDTAVEIIMGHLQEKPPSLTRIRPDFNIPGDLELLIYACLEKDPGIRPQKVKDVCEELRRIAVSARSRGFTRSVKQIPRRLKARIKRSLRRFNESKGRIYKPALVTILAAGAVCYSYAKSLEPPHYSTEQCMERAQLALFRIDREEAAAWYEKAIKEGVINKLPTRALAVLNERAADDLVSQISKNPNTPGPFGWTPVIQNPSFYERMPEDYQTTSRIAKSFAQQAYNLYEGLPESKQDRIRLLEKLTNIAEMMHDPHLEMSLLRERIALDGTEMSNSSNTGAYQKLAELLSENGQFEEAEPIMKKSIEVDRANTREAYPQSIDHLTSLYHRANRLVEEEKLRRAVVEELRAQYSITKSEGYRLKDQLTALATCLRQQNHSAEANALLFEASKVKT